MGLVSALPSSSGDFLSRNIHTVTDEGMCFGAYTRLILLPGLMSVEHQQEPQPFHQKQGWGSSASVSQLSM